MKYSSTREFDLSGSGLIRIRRSYYCDTRNTKTPEDKWKAGDDEEKSKKKEEKRTSIGLHAP
jgi:hypothetical protein